MSNFTISRQSSLFKFVAFLKDFPIFSLFINRVARHYDETTYEYKEDYNTFDDICTFSRHMIFIILSCFFYLFLFGIMINLIVIQPIVYLFGSGSVAGAVTVSFASILIAIYAVLLILQKINDCYDYVKSNRVATEKESVEKEPGFFSKTFELLSQKHHNFCNRLDTKD